MVKQIDKGERDGTKDHHNSKVNKYKSVKKTYRNTDRALVDTNGINNNRNLANEINNSEEEGLIFIAASGVEQIGMNLNIFGYKGKYIIVDVGISFSPLGSGITLPSMNILYDINPDNILAYVITHAHEDHIGGLCRFLTHINKPIYSTKFTMCVIEKKIKENNIKNTERVVVEGEKSFKVGPFDILFTYAAHSIPDSNHIIISTPNASVFHTGDWKFDDAPVIGEKLNKNYLSALAQKHNITALINDSTNAFEFNRVGTEGEAYEGLFANIKTCSGRKVVVSCFSSNLARITSLSNIAKATNRKLILVGRSLVNMTNIAMQNGLLIDNSHIVSDIKKADHIKPGECLYVCTGSQGEINSVLQRCALNLHPHLKINEKDVLILSSRIIPGNEQKIADLKNIFINRGVEIIDHNLKKDELGVLHVSGHPGRDDIKDMVLLTGCKYIIPVHGDAYHLYAVERIIEELLIAHPNLKVKCCLPQGNGTVFRIHHEEGIKIIGKFETNTEVLDGKLYYNINDDIFRQRGILNEHGVIVIIVNTIKKRHFLVNYGAVSKTEWEKSLRTSLYRLIDKSDYHDTESLRNQVVFEIYKKYEKNPIVILNSI